MSSATKTLTLTVRGPSWWSRLIAWLIGLFRMKIGMEGIDVNETNILVIVLSVVLLACIGSVIASTPLALSTSAFQFLTTIASLIVGGAVMYLWPSSTSK